MIVIMVASRPRQHFVLCLYLFYSFRISAGRYKLKIFFGIRAQLRLVRRTGLANCFIRLPSITILDKHIRPLVHGKIASLSEDVSALVVKIPSFFRIDWVARFETQKLLLLRSFLLPL